MYIQRRKHFDFSKQKRIFGAYPAAFISMNCETFSIVVNVSGFGKCSWAKCICVCNGWTIGNFQLLLQIIHVIFGLCQIYFEWSLYTHAHCTQFLSYMLPGCVWLCCSSFSAFFVVLFKWICQQLASDNGTQVLGLKLLLVSLIVVFLCAICTLSRLFK